MRDRTASAEWDDLSAHRTVREMWTLPSAAVRHVARRVLCGLGALVIIAFVARWLSL